MDPFAPVTLRPIGVVRGGRHAPTDDAWATETCTIELAPGFTAGETNDYIVNDPVAAKSVTDVTALRRFGQPEEIADIVYALASPLGRWVTAQNVEASGGFKL